MSGESTVKLPNSMTFDELIGAGNTPDQARIIMNKRVFGDNHEVDAQGKPIEQGKGSAKQPTPQHLAALQLANDRKLHHAQGGAGIGSDVIAQAVAAGVQAGLAAAKDKEADTL